MPDPTSQNQVVLRITGLSGSIKEHIEEHPQFAGLFELDETLPQHRIKRADIPKLIACRIIPFILESFEHYDNDEELLWECGLFDEARIDDGITVVDKEQAKKMLTKLIEELDR